MPDELLDTRVSVVETHIEFIEKELNNNTEEHRAIIDTLDHMKDTVNNVEVHLGKQNGILPRLEDMVNQQYKDQQEIKTCIAGMNTKSKILWSVVSALAAAALTLFIKMVIS